MDTKIVLSGDLKFFNLGEVFQLIGSNGASGILRIKSRYAPGTGSVYFSNGDIINASNGPLDGIKAAYSLFGWTEGEFEFNLEDFKKKKTINASRMEIILDGLRMLDEGEIEKLGPVSFEEKGPVASGKANTIPVIKGPLIDYAYVVEVEEYSKGQMIVQEKKYGSWMWVIVKGTAEIVKETKEGPLTLVKIGEGAFVGSIASFLYTLNIRSASVVATGDVQLGVLDSQRLSEEFSNLSPEFRGLMVSLDKRLREVSDRAVENYLNENKPKKVVTDQEPIITQGKTKQEVLKITQGEATVVHSTDDNVSVLLSSLNKGDFIGRIPFFSIGHEPHSASVFASKDFEADILPLDRVLKEYNKLSSTLKNIIENVSTCVLVSTKVACDFKKRAAKNNA